MGKIKFSVFVIGFLVLTLPRFASAETFEDLAGRVQSEVQPELQIGSLVWGATSKYPMPREFAKLYCQRGGQRLPSSEEWLAFAQALGMGSSLGYDPKFLPDIEGKDFHSLTRDWEWKPWPGKWKSRTTYFSGSTGMVFRKRPFSMWNRLGVQTAYTRCVKSLDPHHPTPEELAPKPEDREMKVQDEYLGQFVEASAHYPKPKVLWWLQVPEFRFVKGGYEYKGKPVYWIPSGNGGRWYRDPEGHWGMIFEAR